MAEMFCSRTALATSLPTFDFAPIEHVELKLLYDAFQPETVETHELEYQEGKFLSEYLDGLPDEAEWMVFFNGEEVSLDVASITPVGQGDRIGLIVLPQGGGGLKSVLRIVLQAAAVALAFTGIGFAAALAINVGIGLINAFLLTPKPPKSSENDERSYGIDGAKNSATEGIPYPVVYGDYRVAGNFSDCFTENVGDNQYLYLRSVLNDGLIDSVTDIEVNEQPIANFRDVQHQIKLGSLTEEVNPWFPSSIRQRNKGVKLDTAWTTHITEDPVDQVRFDVAFSSGLVDIDEKKGKHRARSVTFEMQYRQVAKNITTGLWEPVGAGTWDWLPQRNASNLLPSQTIVRMSGIKAVVVATAPAYVAAPDAPNAAGVIYRKADTSDPWIYAGRFKDVSGASYAYDPSGDGSIAGPTNITPGVTTEVEIDLPEDVEYEVMGTGGAILTEVTTYPRTSSSSVTVTDSRTRAIRRSFVSEQLNKGHYECRIRRTSTTSTSNYIIDEVYLTDVAEIELQPVAMRGTANLSLRIKLTEQLNQIPQLTSRVKGCVVQKYDINGNPTVKEWSDNPAWIGLDILLSEERGAVMPTSRIDWPKWLEFADYCEANSVKFNGVFETGSNIGDALRQVLRIGHAAPIPFGTKISVAIDRARDPVTVFTQASIIAKSFQVTYMSMQDRSNEFEVTYYDKTDRNKAKTIRYVDPKAVTFNEMPRVASVQLVGCDNVVQAKKELWRMVYANRLLIRTISFESFMESINLALGEVALIQHDQMAWAYSGRTKAGSTANAVHLDQKVDMEAGQQHSALVHFSALQVSSAAISSNVGSKILIPTGTASAAALAKVARVITTVDGEDYEVLKYEQGSTYDTFTLDRAVTAGSGTTAQFYQTDVVEERDVSSVTQNADGTTTLNLSSALPAAPETYSNFVFGRVEKVRKPYVLTGVSGSGIDKRKLTFMEYHAGVYGPAEVDIPIPVEQVNDRVPGHVTGLLFDYERLVAADRPVSNVRIYWNAGAIRNYGGADIYMRLNGANWTAIGSALNVTEYTVQLAPTDTAEFKVVAYTTRGDRAPFKTAPMVGGDLNVVYASVDAPLALSASQIAFDVDGTVELSFTPPADTTGIQAYQAQYRVVGESAWSDLGQFASSPIRVGALPVGDYEFQIRSTSLTSSSSWVSAIQAVTVEIGSVKDRVAAMEDGADVTSLISGPSETIVLCDYQGAPKAGQVNPRNVQFSLSRAGVVVSDGMIWTATPSVDGITCTITADGRLNITGASVNGTIDIRATYNGLTRPFIHKVTRKLDEAPTSTSGGTSVGGTINGVAMSSVPEAISAELTVTTGSAGEVELVGNYEFTVSPSYTPKYAKARWYKWNGSAWVAIGTLTQSINVYREDYGVPGEGSISFTDTGNTPSSSQKYCLYGVSDSGATTYYSGTCSATGK